MFIITMGYFVYDFEMIVYFPHALCSPYNYLCTIMSYVHNYFHVLEEGRDRT